MKYSTRHNGLPILTTTAPSLLLSLLQLLPGILLILLESLEDPIGGLLGHLILVGLLRLRLLIFLLILLLILLLVFFLILILILLLILTTAAILFLILQ